MQSKQYTFKQQLTICYLPIFNKSHTLTSLSLKVLLF